MRFKAIFLCFLLALLPSAENAQLEEKCGDAIVVMRYAMTGISKSNYSFSLKAKGQTYWMFFLPKSEGATSKTTWRLMQRQGESTDYCVIGAGDDSEVLQSLHKGNPSNRYGMPGYGYPRCSNGANLLPGSLDVRLWANTELGESTVLSLNSSLGAKNYFLLISKDGYWILLDVSRDASNAACYLARGDATSSLKIFRFHNDESLVELPSISVHKR